jgi:uncharacterized protein DUF3857
MSPSRLQCSLSIGIPLTLLLFTTAHALAAKWESIPPSTLAERKAHVDPEADAEALLWEIRVQDNLSPAGIESEVSQHLRIQVYTGRGAEEFGKVDIPYMSGSGLDDFEARVVRPDGSMVEIKKNAVFDRTIAKGGGIKVKAKSFAAPDLKPGGIVEYRWTQHRRDQPSVRLQLQLLVPIRQVSMTVKPLLIPGDPYQYRVRWNNMRSPNGAQPVFEELANGSRRAEFTNIPAFRTEPHMPPENSVRASVAITYEERNAPAVVWMQFANRYRKAVEGRLQVDSSVEKKVRELLGNDADETAKLARLYDFCRIQIRNVNDNVNGMTSDDLAKFQPSKNPAETLRRGTGTDFDVLCLFVAFARAAGFTSEIALLPDRSNDVFDGRDADPSRLTERCAAVGTSAGWRFFDPTARYIPAGGLPWWKEGVKALIPEWEPRFEPTPISPPYWSLAKRRGVFTIGEDGTLEGDVRTEFTGHWGARRKGEVDENSEAERVSAIEKLVQSRLSNAVVSSVRVEHASDPEGNYGVTYHVRVPGYATRAGRRLIVDPYYFGHGDSPMFTSNRRMHPVYFNYPWAEDDSVAIHIPEGFAAESLPSTDPYEIQGIARHVNLLAKSTDGKLLVYRRQFEFGREGTIYFPLEEYPKLKAVFDTFDERDHRTVVLALPESPR